nr:poly(ADP-ribose) glycohydrolase domain-containing protein [Pseudenhygromyxa sp. WMMC2535]
MRETVAAFDEADPPDRFHRQAAANLARWREARAAAGGPPSPGVQVIAGDWGEVCAGLTKAWGQTFAVLNMANAYRPGGAYVEGTAAQEENLFRRSDCHFALGRDEMDPQTERYLPAYTRLINGVDGRVLLDAERPRVCVRGPEIREREDLGYAWLEPEAIFPFYELRAAALDLRDGRPFDRGIAQAKIAAQLDTLIAAGLRHAVLSAFGCGAFGNPAGIVAALYRDALAARAGAFDCVAFGIFDPGYGPDNYTPFAAAFADP